MAVPPKIHTGTSGWHHPHWEDVFYPAGLAAKDHLNYYCQHFQTVEIKNTFYQLPAEDTVMTTESPLGFTFTIKASRYITHMKKLKDPQEPLENFLKQISLLGEHLGPVLFQLPQLER